MITSAHIALAKTNGISYNTLFVRVNRHHWDIEKAVTEPIRKRKRVNWQDWKDVALSNGISYDNFRTRVNNCGWTEEKAATTPVKVGEKYEER